MADAHHYANHDEANDADDVNDVNVVAAAC